MSKGLNRFSIFAVGLLTMLLNSNIVKAADLYRDAGDNTWDDGVDVEWSTTAGGPYTASSWNNASSDNAILEGTPGTITLGVPITITDLTFNTGDYTISGCTLNFASGATIDHAVDSESQTITTAITGSPSVRIASGSHSPSYNDLTIAPTSGTAVLGNVIMAYEDGSGDKCRLYLGGSTVGNSAASVSFDAGHRWATFYKQGTGTWTILGDFSNGALIVEDGNMYVNGEIEVRSAGFQLNGGVFHYNHAGQVQNITNSSFQLNNGSFDNSSGAAINSLTYNVAHTWGGDWTFIGSNGANSDLTLGTGAVTLSGSRLVTIQNSATTLTVEGTIGDGTNIYGLTKAGSGTLALTGTLDYNGSTNVTAGTLSIGDGTTSGDLDDDAVLSIASGANMVLNFSGSDSVFLLNINGSQAATGTWGATGSGAANIDDTYFSGSGVINNLGGLAPSGTWYWDGPNIGGTGDGASDGGSGTWSTANPNWDQGITTRKVWNDTIDDKAVFRKTAGTVDLQSDVTLGEILIDGVDNYAIGSSPETQTLNFGGVGNIIIDKVYATIRAGITGSPNVHHYGGFRDELYLDPDSVSMTLGKMIIGEDTTSNPRVFLRGTTTNNSVSEVQSPYNWTFLEKEDSGTWTVGDMAIYYLSIEDGTLVVNGTWDVRSSIGFTGGTLMGNGSINKAITVPATVGTMAPGSPTGQLSVTSGTVDIDGNLVIEINGAQNSLLAVTDTLDISTGSSNLQVNGSNLPGEAVIIAIYGTLTGTSFGSESIPSGWSIDYDYLGGGNVIALIPPKPKGTIIRIE